MLMAHRWMIWCLLAACAGLAYIFLPADLSFVLLAIAAVYGAALLLWSAGRALLRMLDAAWHRMALSKEERAVRERDATTESPLERMLAEELDRRGIAYEREYPISRMRVDFAFPAAKLVVECDGWRYHHDAKPRDMRRDNFLRSRGWRVMRFSGETIRKDVAGCAQQISRML